MRRVSLILLTLPFLIASAVFVNSANRTQVSPQNHTEWIARSLKEMETIKVGMTRSDLVKVFRGEGGLSTRKWRQYVYRQCPYIKVEVEFEPVGKKEPPEFTEGSKDKIVKVSRPFLEWSVLD